MNANSTKNNLPIEKTFNGIRFIYFLCLTFSWIFIIPNPWKLGILLTLISVLTYVFSRKKANTEKRAYLYHLYVFLSFFPFSVLSVLASLRLFEKSIIDVQHYLLITGTILLVFLFTFQLFQRMLTKSKRDIIKSGRLDIYSKTWNLCVPLRFLANQKKITSIGCISPLITALAFYFARNLTGDAEMLLRASMLFFFGFSLMLGAAYQLSIVSVIMTWEKEIGAPINISFDKPSKA